MRLKISLLVALLSAITVSSFAGSGFCSRQKPHNAAKTTLADPGEDNYDMKYLRFNINLTDTAVYVWGNVATTAQVTVASMTQYVFELDTSFTIDSAKINGVVLAVTTTGSIRKVTLPTALSLGAVFTAQVFYHGLPPGGTGGFFNGITHSVTGAGTHMVFTISDPYVAKNWWPCKQSVSDKIDSVDMFVSVPRGVVDGSNGVLMGVDTTSVSGFWNYHWKTNYPIDYYLISVAVARYAQYKSYWHFSSSTDSVLIHNFFLDTTTFNPAYKGNFDSLGLYIDYFSSLYGRYPFWKEKYGVCYTSLPGGMEHQTMTTIGVPNTYIIAHELCHQWFGDHVTYRTWGDVWLSEGFATFSEQLFLAHFWSPAAALTHRAVYMNSYILPDACGKVYVDDTTTSDSLFNGRTVYAKAQAVIRMLQYIAPSDSAFFAVLRNYQSNFAFGLASTADFKALAESIYGVNLDTFFNQWIYGRGYPIYNMSWNQAGSTVYVKLVQTASCPTYTSHFNTPLELQLHTGTADTFIKVYNTLDTQLYVFDWSPAMTNCYLNPDFLTICKLNNRVHDHSLGMTTLESAPGLQVYPNPAKNSWQIAEIEEGLDLQLTDDTGRVIWTGKSNKGSTVIPGHKLPAGNYFLKVGSGNKVESVKLVHW